MKPDDQVIIKIEPEDNSYDYYDNSNNISFVHNEVGSESIVSKYLEALNNHNVPSPPSTVQLGVIKAEPGIRDIVPGEKLIDIKSECDLDFIFEEIDFSEDIKPYLLPVEPNVETGDENLKECGLPLDPKHVHTNPTQPEHVDNSSDSDEVDVTTVDNDFSALFREECKKKIKRRQGRKRPGLKHKKRHSAQKASGKRRPAENNGKDAQQKWGKKEAMTKSISAESTSGALLPIPSTRTETRERRIRNLVQQYIPSTSSSSSTSRSSSRSSSPGICELGDEKTREKKNLAEKGRRMTHIDLRNNLRLLIPAINCDRRATEIKILTHSRKYIRELTQNLKTKQKTIKCLRNKKRTLEKTLNNLMKELEDHLLNSR